MRVISSSPGKPTRLAIAESADASGLGAPWLKPLLALGSRTSRFFGESAGRQLVIAVTVPKRDFASALIGCGWVMASESPKLADPLEVLRGMDVGQPLRAVNRGSVITGYFASLDESGSQPRAQFADSMWNVRGIRALTALTDLDRPVREVRPEPGSIEHLARLDDAWDQRLARPTADLAIVGTLTWLEQDLSAHLKKVDDQLPSSSLQAILRPKARRAATWFTTLYSSASLDDHLPLSDEFRAVVLDGNGAIKYISEIEASVVFCVIDRSVGDETAAELLAQLRNTRGEPLSLYETIAWRPPVGVEALAFTLPL